MNINQVAMAIVLTKQNGQYNVTKVIHPNTVLSRFDGCPVKITKKETHH